VHLCKLLALIRLGSAPVSSMKTSIRNNSSTDVVLMEETVSFLGFITATLHSLLLIQFSGSLSRSPDVFCSGPLEVHFLGLRGISRVSRRIISWIITLTAFLNFLLCILTITVWSSVHFLWLPIHCSYCLSHIGREVQVYH